MRLFFTGYSKEYKKYFFDEVSKLKDLYRDSVDINWYEFVHVISKHIQVNIDDTSRDILQNYEKEVYRKYLVDSGVDLFSPKPSKKRKRYKHSYVTPVNIPKDDIYKSRFKKLSRKENVVLHDALGKKSTDILIDKFDINIRQLNIKELYENQWLGDEVINFYMKMLQERDIELCGYSKKRRSSHYYNTFFMFLLVDFEGYNYDNVRKWSRRFKIFHKDKIFCPVNVNYQHWSLLVIYIQEKKIIFYDSAGVNGKKYLEGALQYLVDEADKINYYFDKNDWTLISYADGLPSQENGYDCGVYIMMYADFITDNLPLVFSQEHIDLFRKKICLNILNGSLNYPLF